MSQELEPITNIRGRTPADVIRCLSVLAACHGSSYRAVEVLREQGDEVTHGTLIRWRKLYPRRYAVLHDEIGRELEEQGIRNGREMILELHEAEKLALSKTVEALEAGNVRDPAGTLQRLATTRGITTDKLMLLTGKPTQITENRSVAEILRALEARAGIKATAHVIEAEEPQAITQGS